MYIERKNVIRSITKANTYIIRSITADNTTKRVQAEKVEQFK